MVHTIFDHFQNVYAVFQNGAIHEQTAGPDWPTSFGKCKGPYTENIYYAYQLSMQRGKFRAQVLPLKLRCCHGRQSKFPLETSCFIDVI